MSRISFTAGLSALAIAGSITLAAPAAYAEDACGTDVTTVVVTPAVIRSVDAVTHLEWLWERDVDVPEQSPVDEAGAPTGASGSGASAVEYVTTVGETPDGAGWRETPRREGVAVVHEVTTETSAQAPEGEGWTQVVGSEVVVVDVAAYDEVVSPEVTQILLSPPCGDDDEPVDVAGSPAAVVGSPVDVAELPTAVRESVQVAGPQVLAQGAPSEVAAVLPKTGGPDAWVAPAGLLSLLGGAAVALGARRRSEH